jgi:hypothetical protein
MNLSPTMNPGRIRRTKRRTGNTRRCRLRNLSRRIRQIKRTSRIKPASLNNRCVINRSVKCNGSKFIIIS